MGDGDGNFREPVGDEGAGVGQIQAHRRVRESTSCPAVFVCLVCTRTESDLNLVAVHMPFSVLFPPHSDVLTRNITDDNGRCRGAGNTRGASRGAAGCMEPASGRQLVVGLLDYT